MSTLAAFAGFLGGLAVGALWCRMLVGTTNPHGRWLGKTCWVRPCGTVHWTEHVVVAVSWRGAVCVRPLGTPDRDGYWIKRDNVSWRVRWERPR